MFFHPPRDIPTTVFARLPDRLRGDNAANEWVLAQPAGGPSDSLLEGPSFDREGNLWCVDLPNGRIYRISPDGEFDVVAQYDGWPNGLKFHRDGRVFIADYKNGIMLLDPVNGAVTPYLVRANLERFKAVNDLHFALNGDLYSPTKDRPACTTRPVASSGSARLAVSSACWTTFQARTAW